MRNTLFEEYQGLRLPRNVQLQRIHRVVEEELSPCQRAVFLAYYFEELTLPQIAEARGVAVSTASRTLRRAENRVRRLLKY